MSRASFGASATAFSGMVEIDRKMLSRSAFWRFASARAFDTASRSVSQKRQQKVASLGRRVLMKPLSA